MTSLGHLGVLSLESWDQVWRRNQQLAAHLVRGGLADRITFVGQPRQGLAPRATRHSPEPGIETVVPPLVVPRSAPGGYRLLDAWFRRAVRDADALWINDPAAGVAALRPGRPAVYDVTDDWRLVEQPDRDLRRVIRAEDRLAGSVPTVVCSTVLAERWRSRYGVQAALVPNGVDAAAIGAAAPLQLHGPAPHAVYVGTVHGSRFDVELAVRLASAWPGTVHLVGPNGLPEQATDRLSAHGVVLTGPVPGQQVPRWLVAADVLVCPHLVDDFTLGLDAVKAHEYLATSRPVVATPSCGFQSLTAPGLTVAPADRFVEAALAARDTGPHTRQVPVDWSVRAAAFAAAFVGAP